MSSLESTQDVLTAIYNTVNYKGDWKRFSKYQFKQALDLVYQVYNEEITEDSAYQKLEDLDFDMVPIPLAYLKYPTNDSCRTGT